MSLNDVSRSIMEKLNKYAINLPDPTCTDFLNCEVPINEKQLQGKKEESNEKNC